MTESIHSAMSVRTSGAMVVSMRPYSAGIVFCRHAGGAGLQQMVEAGVFLYQVMRAVGQESADVL